MSLFAIILDKAAGFFFKVYEEPINEELKKTNRRNVLLLFFLILVILIISTLSFFIINAKNDEIAKKDKKIENLTATVMGINKKLLNMNFKLNQDLKEKNIEIVNLNAKNSELQKQKDEIQATSENEIEKIKSNSNLSNSRKDAEILEIIKRRDKDKSQLMQKIADNIEQTKRAEVEVEDLKNKIIDLKNINNNLDGELNISKLKNSSIKILFFDKKSREIDTNYIVSSNIKKIKFILKLGRKITENDSLRIDYTTVGIQKFDYIKLNDIYNSSWEKIIDVTEKLKPGKFRVTLMKNKIQVMYKEMQLKK